MASVTVVANLTMDASLRLAVSTSPAMTSPSYSSTTPTENHCAKLTVTGLSAATTYYYAVEIDGALDGTVGTFRTRAPSASSFFVAFAGDAENTSNHAVFDAIHDEDPDLFIHLGDMHYADIVNHNLPRFLGEYEQVLDQSNQAALYRDVPTVYLWDDHDYGVDDSFATSLARKSACLAYRRRVPHYTLEEGAVDGAIYHAFEVEINGLFVIFIVTDQRSAASNKTATDNSSKTVLGTTQKTWFKALFSNAANDSKLFVWLCSRVWGGVTTAGADHWGGFNTERVELANHFKAEAPGRVIVLSADMHGLAIDDGTNHDFSTGGGDPIPTFQAAPLDKVGSETYGGATYSEGAIATNNNQYGLMTISKTGAAQLTVDWEGKRHTGASLVTFQMIFNL